MRTSNWKQYLFEIDYLISAIAVVILVGLTCTGVVYRYFINSPLVWMEEIQVWMFLWLTFFGGSAAFRSKSHVAIEILVDMLPVKVQKYINVIVYIISMITLVYLFIQCNKVLQLFIDTNKTTDVLRIPSSVYMGGVLVGVALMILNYSLVIIKDLRGKKDGDVE